jgi:hypothetical protein
VPVNHHAPPVFALVLGLVLALVGCDTTEDESWDDPPPPLPAQAAPGAEERPGTRTDTIQLEGMAEPIELRLFKVDDFPLPFSAYVPADMSPSSDSEEGTAHFVAEFGGTRNEDAFVHVLVFPAGTPWQEAVATARGYEAGRGIPAGRGLEPVSDQMPAPSLRWAIEAYRYRYQSGGAWFGGTIGVGLREDRPFLILRHWPQEYAEGFAPRADLITETWRWADGTPLRATGP